MRPLHRTGIRGIVLPIAAGARCRASGLALALLLSFVLLLGATPAIAAAVTDSTATLLWTAPGDDGDLGQASRYDLRYRSTPISGVDTTSWWSAATPATGLPTPSPAGATDSVTVRGLSPATTYYFIIRAADEVPNWSGFSNVAVYTTTGDTTPPAAVADLSATQVTGTSIAVRWTAPGDDGSTGTARSYDIRYSTSPITLADWSSATAVTGEPIPGAAGSAQTYTVSGLSGGRTYYIALRTTDNSGNVSDLSNVVNATTPDLIPPAPIRDLSYRGAAPTESGWDVWESSPWIGVYAL